MYVIFAVHRQDYVSVYFDSVDDGLVLWVQLSRAENEAYVIPVNQNCSRIWTKRLVYIDFLEQYNFNLLLLSYVSIATM